MTPLEKAICEQQARAQETENQRRASSRRMKQEQARRDAAEYGTEEN